MTMLKLREGWQLVVEEGVTYLYPPGEDLVLALENANGG